MNSPDVSSNPYSTLGSEAAPSAPSTPQAYPTYPNAAGVGSQDVGKAPQAPLQPVSQNFNPWVNVGEANQA